MPILLNRCSIILDSRLYKKSSNHYQNLKIIKFVHNYLKGNTENNFLLKKSNYRFLTNNNYQKLIIFI